MQSKPIIEHRIIGSRLVQVQYYDKGPQFEYSDLGISGSQITVEASITIPGDFNEINLPSAWMKDGDSRIMINRAYEETVVESFVLLQRWVTETCDNIQRQLDALPEKQRQRELQQKAYDDNIVKQRVGSPFEY